jgi:threonine dehydrogenase-like Zn-dependent dehydrogenase
MFGIETSFIRLSHPAVLDSIVATLPLFVRSSGMSFQEIATWFSRKPKNTEEVQKINRVLVVGAGTMGTQIALQCASHGRFVLLYDNLRVAVEQAPARLERLAQNLAAKSLLGSSSSRDTLRRIEPNIDMAAAARAPLSSNACQRIWNLKKACSSNWGGIARRRRST